MKNQWSAPCSLVDNYGLHAHSFGAVASLADYQQFHLLHQRNEICLFDVNIVQELEILRSDPQAMVCICVPTCGFTDPALDYILSPCFALPVAINGLVAKEEKSIRALAIGTDIAGNEYPLLTNAQGKIDFALIEKTFNDKKDRFTSLREITFGFTAALLSHCDLIMARQDKQGIIELLVPPTMNTFEFQVKVVKNSKIISNRILTYKIPPQDLPQAKLMAIWQEGKQKSYLHINYKLSHQIKQAVRAKVVVDVPMQEEVDYTWASTPCIKGVDNTYLRFTQYYGLSLDAFKQVICAIISPLVFESGFMVAGKKSSHYSTFNRYDTHPQLKLCLYEHLTNGVLNQSVPLFALSMYFASYDEIKANMQKINWSSFDIHDQFVFKKLYEILLTDEGNVMPLVDEVDRLLSFNPEYCETTLVVETMGKALNAKQFNITANIILEDKSGEVIHSQTSTTLLQMLRRNRQLTLVENRMPVLSKGAVYNLNFNHIVKGAHVIEGFNWQANDKINLSDLMEALKTSGGSSIVHAQITPLGDTEIWVEHASEFKTENYHIATLKGLNHLPGDISHFIEVGRNG